MIFERILLDTHVALVALTVSDRISPRVRREVEAGPVYLSVISYWEVLLKSMKGKLDVGDPRPEHISEVQNLEPIHQDPFDRVLIAQATAEDLTLVTNDAAIARYRSARLRVVS